MFSPPDLPDPTVTITGPTTGVAGEDLQLTCSVSVVEYLVAEPTVQWSGGSVGSENVTESTTATSGVTSERSVTFSPLRTSHGAQYTCQAEVSISSITLVKTGSESRAVMVQSEWLHHVLCTYRMLCPSLSPQSSGDGFWSSRVRPSVWLLPLPHLLHTASRR